MLTERQQLNCLRNFLADDTKNRPLSIDHPTGSAMRYIEKLENRIAVLELEINRLKIYELACESMAKQIIHPKITGEQLAKMQLGEQ